MRGINKIAILVFLILIACGYFENDGIESQKLIVGNIYLQEYKNVDGVCLVHDGGNGMYSIISDCRLAYYDSIEKRIYVQKLIIDSINVYYSIILKDPSNQELWKALEKHEVHEETFKRRITKKSCIQIKI